MYFVGLTVEAGDTFDFESLRLDWMRLQVTLPLVTQLCFLGVGPRGVYLIKFNTGTLRLKVQPLTLLYTILAEKVPLSYTFY